MSNKPLPLFLRPKPEIPNGSSSGDSGASPPSTRDCRASKTQSRKNHTKSRRGCHNCKNRRIKCPENRPQCSHCVNKGLICEWPDLQVFQTGRNDTGNSSSIVMTLQSVSPGPNFKLKDFRLFNHFITDAYPHHPLNNDDVWTREIPSIAHNHDYLLHAMLALSASALLEDDPSSSDLSCTALSHRVSAITSLRLAISNPHPTLEAANAMLATCYALVHQSALLDDGIVEFMTFTRGCVQVSIHMAINSLPFLLRNIIENGQLEVMGPHLQGLPGMDQSVVDQAVSSLQAFEYMCVTDGEKLIYSCILETATGLAVSKRDAYIGLMRIYNCFCFRMSQPDFDVFVSPTNEVGKLLQTHWIAVQSLLDPITVHEQGKRMSRVRAPGANRWMRQLLKNVKPEMLKFYEWPIAQTHKLYDAKQVTNWVISEEDTTALENIPKRND